MITLMDPLLMYFLKRISDIKPLGFIEPLRSLVMQYLPDCRALSILWCDWMDGSPESVNVPGIQRVIFSGWWFGCHFLFYHILGMSSSQLTNIFQRGGPTTNQFLKLLVLDLVQSRYPPGS